MDLTNLRRLDGDRPDCGQVYSGDIRAVHIAKATGINGVTHWSWSAGFYPGSRPGEIRCGTAKTYELATIASNAPGRTSHQPSRDVSEDIADEIRNGSRECDPFLFRRIPASGRGRCNGQAPTNF